MKQLFDMNKIGAELSQYFKGVVLGGFVVMCLGLLPQSARGAWEKTNQPPTAEAPADLALCSDAPACFYAADSHRVFKNLNQAWETAFNLSAFNDSIVRIRSFSNEATLWIQTTQNIYCLDPLSGKSIRVYETTSPEKYPLSFTGGKNDLWVGTSAGLWSSRDAGKTWRKESGLADSMPVSLASDSSIGLFFSVNGEWRINEEGHAQNVLKVFDFHETEDSEKQTEHADESLPQNNPVIFDFVETEESFYLATIKGVFHSQNGYDWCLLSNSGLRQTAVKRILWNKKAKQLVGLTDQGVFLFDPKAQRWIAHNEGLAKSDMRAALFIVASDAFVAVNSEGLWQWTDNLSGGSVADSQAILFNRLIHFEPSARDIQKRVIRYSDTGNGKIKRWHAESRLAALLPNLSAGKDWGTSNNIDLDRGGTSDPDRFINGPWNRDRGADLDLSWNLGDFIFSSSQTSIDSRAKYNIDLRNDLLAEATRLFYERRRLQAEIVYSPAADEKSHLDQLLRLDELTSLLDALTDGYLSDRLEKIYQQNQELSQIWEYK